MHEIRNIGGTLVAVPVGAPQELINQAVGMFLPDVMAERGHEMWKDAITEDFSD